MTKYLSAQDILKSDDAQFEEIEITEWGGVVRIKGMTGAQRDNFEASVRGSNGRMNMSNVRARLAALTLVDDTGARLFTETQIKELGKKSASALDKIFDASMRLSGLREDDIDELTENLD